jgi:nucleotide-binding universal stress UspA family protein
MSTRAFERSCLVAPEAATVLFDRVLCGVDETPESLDAVRQAVRLRAVSGTLAVVSAVDLTHVVRAGWAATPIAVDIEQAAERGLEAAHREAPEAVVQMIRGRPVDVLLAEAKRIPATLVAVGSHGHRRGVGIALGGVATTMLHEAPCSVLVARRPAVADKFPQSIVVGIDGSRESALAAAVAFSLGERFGAEVWPVASTSGKEIDLDAVRAIATGVGLDKRRPVDVLVTASRDANLLVVGSRGLHGLAALGSVSERVAHSAPCSVLVVRPAAP